MRGLILQRRENDKNLNSLLGETFKIQNNYVATDLSKRSGQIVSMMSLKKSYDKYELEIQNNKLAEYVETFRGIFTNLYNNNKKLDLKVSSRRILDFVDDKLKLPSYASNEYLRDLRNDFEKASRTENQVTYKQLSRLSKTSLTDSLVLDAISMSPNITDIELLLNNIATQEESISKLLKMRFKNKGEKKASGRNETDVQKMLLNENFDVSELLNKLPLLTPDELDYSIDTIRDTLIRRLSYMVMSGIDTQTTFNIIDKKGVPQTVNYAELLKNSDDLRAAIQNINKEQYKKQGIVPRTAIYQQFAKLVDSVNSDLTPEEQNKILSRISNSSPEDMKAYVTNLQMAEQQANNANNAIEGIGDEPINSIESKLSIQQPILNDSQNPKPSDNPAVIPPGIQQGSFLEVFPPGINQGGVLSGQKPGEQPLLTGISFPKVPPQVPPPVTEAPPEEPSSVNRERPPATGAPPPVTESPPQGAAEAPQGDNTTGRLRWSTDINFNKQDENDTLDAIHKLYQLVTVKKENDYDGYDPLNYRKNVGYRIYNLINDALVQVYETNAPKLEIQFGISEDTLALFKIIEPYKSANDTDIIQALPPVSNEKNMKIITYLKQINFTTFSPNPKLNNYVYIDVTKLKSKMYKDTKLNIIDKSIFSSNAGSAVIRVLGKVNMGDDVEWPIEAVRYREFNMDGYQTSIDQTKESEKFFINPDFFKDIVLKDYILDIYRTLTLDEAIAQEDISTKVYEKNEAFTQDFAIVEERFNNIKIPKEFRQQDFTQMNIDLDDASFTGLDKYSEILPLKTEKKLGVILYINNMMKMFLDKSTDGSNKSILQYFYGSTIIKKFNAAIFRENMLAVELTLDNIEKNFMYKRNNYMVPYANFITIENATAMDIALMRLFVEYNTRPLENPEGAVGAPEGPVAPAVVEQKGYGLKRITSPDYALKRLELILGSVKAGNNNKMLKEEGKMLIQYLLRRQVFDNNDYNKYMSMFKK